MNMKYQNKMVRETLCFWKASMMDGELERSWKHPKPSLGNHSRFLTCLSSGSPVILPSFPCQLEH